jgi:hypothetical protein
MVNVLDLDVDPFEAHSIEEYESVGFVDHAHPSRNNTVPSESEIDVVLDDFGVLVTAVGGDHVDWLVVEELREKVPDGVLGEPVGNALPTGSSIRSS